MKLQLLLPFLALLLMGNNSLPPEKYQVNAPPSVVVIVSDPNTKEACGVAEPGRIIRACEFNQKTKHGTVPLLLMPNPCTFPEAAEDMSYAHLLCHELGHANGWNAEHDN